MKKFLNSTLSDGTILVSALMAANFLNFVFNAYLGRVLSLEDFSVLAVVNTIWLLLGIFINSLIVTTNHYVAFYIGKGNYSELISFLHKLRKNSLLTSIAITAIWVFITPILSTLLGIEDTLIILSIAPLIFFGTLLALRKGYLQGSFFFRTLAVLVVAEPISKLAIAFAFENLGLEKYIYTSIPLSALIALIIAYIFSVSYKAEDIPPPEIKVSTTSPLTFYVTAAVNGVAGAAFLSVDILIVKHFMASDQAGAYALLSLVGKMIYFLGTLLNGFVITYISRDLGKKADYKTTFYKIFAISTLLTFIGYIAFGYFGHFTIPFLLGNKANLILGYINLYGIGIAAFTLSTSVVAFHLSKKNYFFSYVGLFSTLLMAIGLSYSHSSISSVVNIIVATSVLHFVVIMLLHLYYVHIQKEPVILAPFGISESLINQFPVKVSICLPAYNEGKNIGKLLDKLLVQKTKDIRLHKIIVISSASTDNTDDIVREYETRDDRIMLLTEDERNGKASAINLFLKHVEDPIVVVQSTDTIPDENTIENLCAPFLYDEFIGMTGGAPIPVNDRNTFLGYVVHTWWWFHRHIPRFGEIIAFRNILSEISPNTSVDEAYIQAKFVKLGYRVVHVDEAIVYNKGAERLKDMIKQRRRIHNGHLRLNDEESVKVGHLTKNALWLLLFKYEIKNIKEFIWLMGGICIEIIAVLLAVWDKRVKDKNPVVWDIAKSTKNLISVRRGKS